MVREQLQSKLNFSEEQVGIPFLTTKVFKKFWKSWK